MSQKASFGKALTFWLGSFLLSAIVMFFYFKVSLGAVLLAGIVTFLITWARYFLLNRNKPV